MRSIVTNNKMKVGVV